VRGECHGARRNKGGGHGDVLPERSGCLALDLKREIAANVVGGGVGKHQPVKVKRPGQRQSKGTPRDGINRKAVHRQKRMPLGVNLHKQIMA
jgi:hypothetical protein